MCDHTDNFVPSRSLSLAFMLPSMGKVLGKARELNLHHSYGLVSGCTSLVNLWTVDKNIQSDEYSYYDDHPSLMKIIQDICTKHESLVPWFQIHSLTIGQTLALNLSFDPSFQDLITQLDNSHTLKVMNIGDALTIREELASFQNESVGSYNPQVILGYKYQDGDEITIETHSELESFAKGLWSKGIPAMSVRQLWSESANHSLWCDQVPKTNLFNYWRSATMI